MRISNRFEKHIVAAATVAMSAAAANASVVNWNCNVVIPYSQSGRYFNLETQTVGQFGNQVPGWNINVYGIQSDVLRWWPGDAAPRSGFVTGLGQGGTSAGVASLSAGTVVGAASTFGAYAASVTQGGWMLNAANYFGFYFVASDNLVHYGYGVMTIGENMGVRTLTSVSYESVAETSITVVPAPGALALLGLAGFAGRRRRS
jgi:hypothetical protein